MNFWVKWPRMAPTAAPRVSSSRFGRQQQKPLHLSAILPEALGDDVHAEKVEPIGKNWIAFSEVKIFIGKFHVEHYSNSWVSQPCKSLIVDFTKASKKKLMAIVEDVPGIARQNKEPFWSVFELWLSLWPAAKKGREETGTGSTNRILSSTRWGYWIEFSMVLSSFCVCVVFVFVCRDVIHQEWFRGKQAR